MMSIFRKSLVATAVVGTLSGCTLTVEIVGEGAVTSEEGKINCPEECEYNYEMIGQPVKLRAEPAAGYVLVGFDGGASVCINPDYIETSTCVVSVSAPRTVTVRFRQDELVDLCPDDLEDNCLANPGGDFDGDEIKNSEDSCPEDENNLCADNDVNN